MVVAIRINIMRIENRGWRIGNYSARQSRNRNSEYLPAKTPRPQRSEKMKGWFVKIINLSVPNLAYFAPWRESIPVFLFDLTPTEVTDARGPDRHLHLAVVFGTTRLQLQRPPHSPRERKSLHRSCGTDRR